MTIANKYKAYKRYNHEGENSALLFVSRRAGIAIGLICGIIAPFLSARVSVMFMTTRLALLGAAFLFYLINRYVFKDEHAGERGF
jgi:hypothetical protein